jgi:hypothetical protein
MLTIEVRMVSAGVRPFLFEVISIRVFLLGQGKAN